MYFIYKKDGDEGYWDIGVGIKKLTDCGNTGFVMKNGTEYEVYKGTKKNKNKLGVYTYNDGKLKKNKTQTMDGFEFFGIDPAKFKITE
tara:strand:+ start:127 stop:390 length:264 start_codon:yes stop_codon:yes gene_type:complete